MMRSSMFSPSKKLDQEVLLLIASMVETLVRINTPTSLDTAEQFGATYLALETKLATFDYTTEDQQLTAFNQLSIQ